MATKIFYIYLDRTLNGIPFYIGKGDLKRVNDFKPYKRNKHHCNIVNSYGIIREIIFETDVEKDAFDKEIEMIAFYKLNHYKYPDKFSTNYSDGGEGPNGAKNKMKDKRDARNSYNEINKQIYSMYDNGISIIDISKVITERSYKAIWQLINRRKSKTSDILYA
jgi:hypothetical protein